MSPFESISNVIDWMTSVKGLPISVLQALSLVGRGSSYSLPFRRCSCT